MHNNVLQASLLLKYAKAIQNNFSSSFPSISHTNREREKERVKQTLDNIFLQVYIYPTFWEGGYTMLLPYLPYPIRIRCGVNLTHIPIFIYLMQKFIFCFHNTKAQIYLHFETFAHKPAYLRLTISVLCHRKICMDLNQKSFEFVFANAT